MTFEVAQTCAEEACYNLGDLASNLGFGRPLARVTGWAKKSRFDKSVLEKLMSFTCSRDAREL